MHHQRTGVLFRGYENISASGAKNGQPGGKLANTHLKRKALEKRRKFE